MKLIFTIIYLIPTIFFAATVSEENNRTETPSETTSPRDPEKPIDLIKSGFIVDDKRLLIPGDMVRFQIAEDEDRAIVLKVNDDGFIDFPYIGQIKVIQKTCRNIKDEIEPLLEKEYYYKATVFIGLERGNPIRGKVYLIGEVESQGPRGIPVDTEFTLSKAILSSGGFTAYANKEKVSILRRNAEGIDETFIVDAEKIFDDGVRENDPILKPDDYIYIPKSRINF